MTHRVVSLILAQPLSDSGDAALFVIQLTPSCEPSMMEARKDGRTKCQFISSKDEGFVEVLSCPELLIPSEETYRKDLGDRLLDEARLPLS